MPRESDNVTIIIPTYNEQGSLPWLVNRMYYAADGVHILVVDDSPNDETAEVARMSGCDVIHRKDKKGLSSAVIDGIKHSNSDKIIVMDADLQHPPELIPRILEELETHDFVVASRYVDGGSCEEWDLDRKLISRVANLAARPLTNVKDAVSGFFGFRTAKLPDLNTVSIRGFKIMLELLVKGSWDSVVEIPYTFGVRTRGRTKMRWEQIRDYLIQLASLYLYKFRILRFGIIGVSGVLIHLPILYLLTEFVRLPYLLSAIIGIICASTSNYFLNHFWTFSGQRSAAPNHFLGWGKYQLMSGITDGLYLGTLALLVELGGIYYMLSATLAMVIIFIFKYLVAKHWIWRRHK